MSKNEINGQSGGTPATAVTETRKPSISTGYIQTIQSVTPPCSCAIPGIFVDCPENVVRVSFEQYSNIILVFPNDAPLVFFYPQIIIVA